MAEPMQRRMGRPPKGDDAKRRNFNTRIHEAVRAFYEAEAAKAGRSLSEEVERTLLQRIEREETVAQILEMLLGGQRTGAVLMHFAAMSHLGGERDRWLDDYKHFQFVVDKINVHLKRIAPPSPPEVDEYFEHAKRTIEQFRVEPDPKLSLTMDSPPDRRIREHLMQVRAIVGQATTAGLDADRRGELRRLLADAERDAMRGFGPPSADPPGEPPPSAAAPERGPATADPDQVSSWDAAFDRAADRS